MMLKLKLNLQLVGATLKSFLKTEMIEEVASALADEKAVGWMQGRMEFGPRALGGRDHCRSSLPIMQKQLTLK